MEPSDLRDVFLHTDLNCNDFSRDSKCQRQQGHNANSAELRDQKQGMITQALACSPRHVTKMDRGWAGRGTSSHPHNSGCTYSLLSMATSQVIKSHLEAHARQHSPLPGALHSQSDLSHKGLDFPLTS